MTDKNLKKPIHILNIMAADLKEKDVNAMLQAIQYWDDSVEAWFRDGSKLFLTGCGTASTYWGPARAPNSGRLGRGDDRGGVHQLTCYVLSEYRDKVAAVVTFRNRFADRVSLTRRLVEEQSIQTLSSPCLHARWPKRLREAKDHVSTADDGRLQLSSLEGHACVTLAPHKQTLTTSFLLRLANTPRGSTTESEKDREQNGLHLASKGEGPEGRGHGYVWTSMEHSVTCVPYIWRHAVDLLLQVASGVQDDTCNKENESESAVVSTPLPTPLPVTCPNPHLHSIKTDKEESQPSKPVKVLYSEGVLYRLLSGPTPCVEAYPSPSTVLRSRDTSGRYFSLCSSTREEGLRESVVCTDLPPPSSVLAHGYSLARIIGQARRLVSSVRNTDVSQVTACWKVFPQPPPPTPPHQLSSAHIPGLGRFTAHSSGHVRVVFVDRMTLDLHCPTLSLTGQRSLALGGGAVLGPGMCRVLSPNGRQEIVPTSHTTPFARYIQVAMDWCEWLSTPPDHRGQFYQGTVYDETTTRMVLAELDKIRQFDHALLSGRSPLDTSGCPGWREGTREGCVQAALHKTTTALRDIDQILQKTK